MQTKGRRDHDAAVVTKDPKHDAVLECTERHQVVLAPPGAGKTHVSVRLAGHLASALPSHSRVLLLTFSRQARSQLEREAVAQLPSEVRQQIEITNYHRLFWTAVRSYRRVLDLPMALDIGSQQRREQALLRASPDATAEVAAHQGLLDSLAEHAFPEFHDRRTPEEDALGLLLDAIEGEHRAGFLVFDDLGALFWRLLEQHRPIADAYAERYPIVIADEHQDASALQDAVARRFGQQRLVVLGDTMQLIHEYRGASTDRFKAHLQQAGHEHRLVTPHRWERVNPSAGRWLTQVRNALYGWTANPGRPAGFVWSEYEDARGNTGVAQRVVQEVHDARKVKAVRSIAVLVRRRDDLNGIEKQLLRRGFFPRRVSGGEFEDARRDIEKLPILKSVATVRKYALDRLRVLAPTFDPDLMRQLKRRLSAREIRWNGAAPRALPFLDAMQPIYERKAAGYLHAMNALLVACDIAGFPCPRSQQARAIRDAAAQLDPGCDLDTVLVTYADIIRRAAMAPQPTDRGIFLMTAHQSKGKEFDAVIIARFSADRWPDDPETRRLLYVALTRATRRWCLVAPDKNPSPLGAILP